jgi:hypothetical protein
VKNWNRQQSVLLNCAGPTAVDIVSGMTGRFPRRIVVVAALLCLFVGDTAAPHTMTVPFFRDEGSVIGDSGPETGAAGFITVKNMLDEPVTFYLVYAQNDPSGDAQLQQATEYTIGGNGAVSWRPVQDDPAEGEGRNVPNVLTGSGNYGSLVIYWIGGDEMDGALTGRYQEFTSGEAMMHVLIEQQPETP